MAQAQYHFPRRSRCDRRGDSQSYTFFTSGPSFECVLLPTISHLLLDLQQQQQINQVILDGGCETYVHDCSVRRPFSSVGGGLANRLDVYCNIINNRSSSDKCKWYSGLESNPKLPYPYLSFGSCLLGLRGTASSSSSPSEACNKNVSTVPLYPSLLFQLLLLRSSPRSSVASFSIYFVLECWVDGTVYIVYHQDINPPVFG